MSHTHDAHDSHDAHAPVQEPEETEPTEEGSRALVSPPEGFDAYNAAHEHGEHEHIHIPPPSYWPIVLSICITILFTGFITTLILTGVGAVLTIFCVIMWGLEGSESIPNALTDIPVVGGGDATARLSQGASVVTTDGKVIGRITQASEKSPLVRQGWIPTRYGYLARSFIDHIEEGLIYLNVSDAEAKQRGNVETTPAGPNLVRLGAGSEIIPTHAATDSFVIEKES